MITIEENLPKGTAPEQVAPLPPFASSLAEAQDADCLLALGRNENPPCARCALWWNDTPVLDGRRTGYIGHYAAADADSGSELLSRACRELAKRGVSLAIGPIDGNTWRHHRLAIRSSGRAPFFMEPRNPGGWARHFSENGFDILARYSSSVVDLTRPMEESELDALCRRLALANGVSLRAAKLDRIEDELRTIFRLSLVAFRSNFLFQPIAEAEFLEMYGRVAPILVPEFVRIAEVDGEIAGFVFGVPDVEGESGRALIVKTVAVLPERRFAGLGNLLVRELHACARARGYTEAIHALQHERNPSLRISEQCGARVFRGYALFARDLASSK